MVNNSNDDGRIPLELESFTRTDTWNDDEGVYIFKFYYPTSLDKELHEDIVHYKDKVYVNMTTYNVCPGQNILTFRTPSVSLGKKEATKVINEILRTDNGALLNTMHPVEFIKDLAGFKIRFIRKEQFTFEDMFGENPDNLFDE
jgi:hypothetical protein